MVHFGCCEPQPPDTALWPGRNARSKCPAGGAGLSSMLASCQHPTHQAIAVRNLRWPQWGRAPMAVAASRWQFNLEPLTADAQVRAGAAAGGAGRRGAGGPQRAVPHQHPRGSGAAVRHRAQLRQQNGARHLLRHGALFHGGAPRLIEAHMCMSSSTTQATPPRRQLWTLHVKTWLYTGGRWHRSMGSDFQQHACRAACRRRREE